MTVYFKDKNTNPIPYVKDVLCDYISFTFEVPDDEKTSFKKAVEEIKNYGPKGNYEISRAVAVNKAYQPFGADKTGKTNLIIQCGPQSQYKKKGLNYARFQWNPSKTVAEDVHSVIDSLLPNLYNRLMLKGRVTQIDLTVDVVDVHCDELLFHYPKSRVTQVWTDSGRTEYIGARKSPTFIRIYDKTVQIKKFNSKNSKELKEEIPERPTTRIEISLKPKKKSLGEIGKLGNPFAKLSVCAYTEINLKNDTTWQLFLDSCRFRGAVSALMKIKGSKQQKLYRDRIRSSKVNWWEPEHIWNKFPNVIARILLPSMSQDELVSWH